MSALFRILFVGLLLIQPAPVLAEAPSLRSSSPRLVVVFVIDQLRHDFLQKYGDAIGPDGFRALLSRGTSFSQAHFAYANTETSAGHSTIATGVNPDRHGVIGNDWYDKARKQSVYSAEDLDQRTFLPDGGFAPGRSPVFLMFPTVGDNLIEQSANNRVFSVSLKDRAAILTSGRRGKAFWYNNEALSFVTGSYYYQSLPAWIKSLTAICSTQPEPRESKGDLLTLDLALSLIEREKLGAGRGSDLLYINLSQTDRIGHAFGWDGPEMKTHLSNIDRGLATFLRSLWQTIPFEQTAVVLTADHGAISSTDIEGRPIRSIPRYFSIEEFGINLSERITEKFGIKERAYSYFHPYIYINESALKLGRVTRSELLAFIGDTLVSAGVAEKVFRTDTFGEYDVSSEGDLLTMVKRNYFRDRSGDLHVIPKRGTFIHDDRESRDNFLFVLHASPWDYDRHVPLIVVGPGFSRRKVVQTHTDVASVAATVGTWLGVPYDPRRAPPIKP